MTDFQLDPELVGLAALHGIQRKVLEDQIRLADNTYGQFNYHVILDGQQIRFQGYMPDEIGSPQVIDLTPPQPVVDVSKTNDYLLEVYGHASASLPERDLAPVGEVARPDDKKYAA